MKKSILVTAVFFIAASLVSCATIQVESFEEESQYSCDLWQTEGNLSLKVEFNDLGENRSFPLCSFTSFSTQIEFLCDFYLESKNPITAVFILKDKEEILCSSEVQLNPENNSNIEFNMEKEIIADRFLSLEIIADATEKESVLYIDNLRIVQ